ncbi:signal recognition particle-docking protein FtsY [Candidatus Woesearchaeota archaeon]|nr:signal recognition particle-docking protein FtsY [Candidatus Woesearchaeota archaeon]
MICDDKKGICIPVELAELQKPKAETKSKEQQKEPAPKEKSTKQEEKIQSEPVKEEKKSIFTKAKEFITTRTLSEEQFTELFGPLERVLLESNVALDVVDKIKEDLKQKLVNRPLPRNLEQVVQQSLKDSLATIVTDSKDILQYVSKKQFVIAFFGINGSGKTTTIAKIAHLMKDAGKSCVIAAGDTFRAAAIQQLEEHGQKLGIRVIKHNYGADAAAVGFDAIKFAEKNNIDVVLIDTAGRLHSDSNLMDELKKIVRVTKPDLKIFVGESITGNDCIEQAEKFNSQIGIDGIILTKADIDDKGGTALSISFVTQKPILYVGTGQEYDDLTLFNRDLVLKNLGLA